LPTVKSLTINKGVGGKDWPLSAKGVLSLSALALNNKCLRHYGEGDAIRGVFDTGRCSGLGGKGQGLALALEDDLPRSHLITLETSLNSLSVIMDERLTLRRPYPNTAVHLNYDPRAGDGCLSKHSTLCLLHKGT